VTWRTRHFGMLWKLTSAITAMDRPAFFQDAMIHGPFGSMKHDHLFRSLSVEESEMTDVFCFSAPLGFLGRAAESVYLARYMRALLHERNRVLQQITESSDWRKYLQ
jgi:ligand-binding SRPBCC domain-containing protein